MDILLIVVIFLAAMIFPLWVAERAYKKGLKTWGIITAILTPLGVGWLVAIFVALQMSKTDDPKSIAELDSPCPKCGGTQGVAHTGLADRKTQAATPSRNMAILTGVWAVIAIGGGLLIAISVWQGGDSWISGSLRMEWESGSFLAGLSFLAIGIFLGRPGVLQVLKYRDAERVETTFYKCKACKHQWNGLQVQASPADAEEPALAAEQT